MPHAPTYGKPPQQTSDGTMAVVLYLNAIPLLGTGVCHSLCDPHVRYCVSSNANAVFYFVQSFLNHAETFATPFADPPK